MQKYKIYRHRYAPQIRSELTGGIVSLCHMKSLRIFLGFSFTYRKEALLTIGFNLLFVLFNLISLVLFIPFLQMIFTPDELGAHVEKPIWKGIGSIVQYATSYFDYIKQSMAQTDPKAALLFVCLSVFTAFFLKNIFRYGAIWHQSQLRMSVVRDIKDKLYVKALRLPISFYTEERKGDLMARMNSDVNEIEVAVVSILEMIFREPIAIVMSIGSMLIISPELTLISFTLLPISAFVISRIGKSLKRTAKAGQEQNGMVFSALEETLGGIRVIKAFNAVNYVQKHFAAINLRHQQLITRTFRKKDLASPLNETIGAGVMICLVWFGGIMILEAQSGLTGAKFITFIVIFSQLLRPIQGISTNMGSLNKAEPSLDRINEILNLDEKVYEVQNPIPLTEFKESIGVNNISFKYKDEWVLKNIQFELKKGKTLAIVGESGSGKSTLADLLPRFYDVNEGSISIDGKDIRSYKLFDLNRAIGVVSQESILFNDTVKNNIAFGNENATLEEVMEVARIAQAHDFISQLENGYETIIGERGNKLSGGQKQRVSIARALLKKPPILILDEATSALDTESEKLVQDALEALMQNSTTIMIAHRLSTVRNADEIIVLSKGEIIERGSHQELLQLKGNYFNLCALQGIHS